MRPGGKRLLETLLYKGSSLEKFRLIFCVKAACQPNCLWMVKASSHTFDLGVRERQWSQGVQASLELNLLGSQGCPGTPALPAFISHARITGVPPPNPARLQHPPTHTLCFCVCFETVSGVVQVGLEPVILLTLPPPFAGIIGMC